MHSRLSRLFVQLLGAALLLSQPARSASSWDGKGLVDYVLSVETDRADALYHQGETVTFKVRLQHQQMPASSEEIDWIISKDGVMPPLAEGKVTLKDGAATLTGTLDEPGFLQCKVSFKDEKSTFTALAAAAVDPTQLKPSLPAPDDFDAFWAAQKARLAAVPLNIKLVSVPPPTKYSGVETFSFEVDSIGAPSTGYYGRPAGAKPKSLPAVLFVPGAGVRTANLDGMASWAGSGLLVAEINAHGIPNGQPPAFYAALDAGELKDYRTRGRESRDTYYFQGVYFRMLRALEFLTAQPEWDGRTLVLLGGSQGGGLSLAGAALDQRVTMVESSIPGLTDHTGMVAGRIAGWPKAIPKGPDGKPNPKILETLRYYDGVNFAARIKAPVYMSVGFLDVICPATCTYVAYNNLTAPKHMTHYVDRGHDIGPHWDELRQLVLAHVADMKTK